MADARGADGPAIAVFEKRPRWTPELQRQFVDEAVRVAGCRSTADLDVLLPAGRPGVIVLDLEAAATDCLQYLGRRAVRDSRRPVVVIGSDRTGSLEWALHEMGVVAFIYEDAVTGRDLARFCRRQWSVER